MPYVVGNVVEGYCKKCKADTSQTVIEIDGHQIRLVRCNECSAEEPYRSPRVRTKVGLREVAAKRKSRAPVRRQRKKQEDPAEVHRQLLEGKDLSEVTPYNVAKPLDVGQVIDHPKFGIGVVVTVVEPTKANVAFEDRARVMICNRK